MNGNALMIGGILIFVLLVIQFNSLVKPLMILITLPLAAGGGMLGLFLMGLPLPHQRSAHRRSDRRAPLG